MANKHSIMTREMVESFCNSYYIPDEVHPTAPGRDRTITQFPEGKVGVYTRLFDYCGYRIPLTKFFVAVLKYFRIHISQLSPFGAARISHFEVLTRILSSNKALFRRYPECFLALVGLSPYYPAKRLGIDHPSLASGTGGKSLASLRQSFPEGSLTLGASSPADIPTHVTVPSSCAADAPVYTAADIVTSSRGKTLVLPTSGVGGSSQPETSEESTDSFYETAVLNSEDAKRWYIPRWNITNDSLLDDGFSCRTLVDRVAPPGFFSTLRNMDYDQLFAEFNVGAARQICLGSEVRSRAEHELELLGEKDAEIARLKSLVKEKETESAEVLRLRDQVSVLAVDKSLLSAEVSALKSTVLQKDTDISLLDSRALITPKLLVVKPET
ncbi:hypothetical protein Tco_1149311 [Tanacetum coccineum]